MTNYTTKETSLRLQELTGWVREMHRYSVGSLLDKIPDAIIINDQKIKNIVKKGGDDNESI